MHNERASDPGFRAIYAACFVFVYVLTNRAWNSLCLQSQIALYLGVNGKKRILL